MVAPVFKKATDPATDPTNVKFGAADLKYAFDVLDGSDTSWYSGTIDRVQASVIEGIPKVYTAFVKFEGATPVARNADGNVLTTSTTHQTVLQNALNQGGHVSIGPGTYNTTTILSVPSDTWVDADVNAVIRGAGNHGLLRNVNWQETGPTERDHNIFVTGGTWDGNTHNNTTPYTDVATINFEYGGPYWVDNTQILWSASEGIKVRQHSNTIVTNNYIFHTKMQDNGPGGALLTGKAGIIAGTLGREIIVANNIIEDSGGESVGMYDLTGRAIISGNICRRVSHGRGHILLEGSFTGGEQGLQHLIVNNTVNSKYFGINVMSNIGAVIANNHITTQAGSTTNHPEGEAVVTADGIRIHGGSEKMIITGNYIHDCDTNGIRIGSGGGGVPSSDILVANNLIKNVSRKTADTYDGIRVEPGSGGTSNVKICNNMILDDRTTPRNRYAIFINNPQGITISNLWIHDNTAFSNLSGGVVLSWAVASSRLSGDIRIMNNSGSPGTTMIASPFNNTHNEIGLRLTGGAVSATPEPSTMYTVVACPISVTSTGGSGVTITVSDPSGNDLVSGVSTVSGLYLARGFRISFGAFSTGSPPSVTVVPHG
jgi:hypothetical protein